MGCDEQAEAMERAVQEVEALGSIYGYDEGGFTVHSRAALQAALACLEDGAALQAVPLDIELQVKLELEMGSDDNGPTARLRCCLPPGYPALSCATVSVAVEGLRRAACDELSAGLAEKAQALLGEEACMELVQELQELAPEVIVRERLATAAAASRPKEEKLLPRFGRRWVWAQTVTKAPNRAKAVGWAIELGLGGCLKPGSPGIFVFEGEDAACDTFISWLKAVPNSCLRALSVRGCVQTELPSTIAANNSSEVAEAVNALRQLPAQFQDLGDSDMGHLSALCKQCGLEGEFLEYVMQGRAGSASREPEPQPQPPAGGDQLICCSFHHLLAGKSHTKEQQIVAAAKSLGLRGLVIYGTPGIVVLLVQASEVAAGERSRTRSACSLCSAFFMFRLHNFRVTTPTGCSLQTRVFWSL